MSFIDYLERGDGTLSIPVIVKNVELYIDCDPLYRVEFIDDLLCEYGVVKTDDWNNLDDEEKFWYIHNESDWDYNEIIEIRKKKEYKVEVIVDDSSEMRKYIGRGNNDWGAYESNEWYKCDEKFCDFIFDGLCDEIGHQVYSNINWKIDMAEIRHKKISELGL